VGLVTYGTDGERARLQRPRVPARLRVQGHEGLQRGAGADAAGPQVRARGCGCRGGERARRPPPLQRDGAGGSSSANRFLMPVSEGSEALERILDELAGALMGWRGGRILDDLHLRRYGGGGSGVGGDRAAPPPSGCCCCSVTRGPSPWTSGPRAARARRSPSACSLLERSVGKQGARIMLFMGGPCNVGPGAVVNRPLVETMRSTQRPGQGKGARGARRGASE